MNRRPFDPRLLRRVPAARRDLAVLAALGGLTALLVVAQATALATVLATAIHGRLDTVALAGFVTAVGARAVVSWGRAPSPRGPPPQ